MKDVKIILKTAADLTGLTKLHRAIQQNIPGLKSLEDGFKKAGQAAVVMGQIAGKAFDALKVGALGLTAAIAGSVREFAAFNVGMARAWTMMDTGVQGFREMRSSVVDLSAELGVAKDQLSSGLYQALSAGVPKDNVLDFLRTAAKVSVADGSTIETAVDGITTVLNAWGMEAARTDEVTDKMFKTVANGKTTFGQLAASISQAAPVAASMGVSVDELLASVATLTKQGVPTATAMVQIRNALTLTNEQLGDGWRSSRTFQEALNEIANTAGNSQQALTKIFGRETVAAISALTGANFSNAANDLAAMAESGGALEGAFGKVQGEVGHWPKLWQNIRAIVNDIGEQFDTEIRPSINFMTEKLNEFRKGDNFKGFASGLAEAVTGFIERLIAGIMTAVDILKTAWIDGPTAMAVVLKTVVTETITLAATTLIEFLRANINFFATLGKVVGGAIKEEVLKLDIPGINDTNRRVKAAAQSLEGRTFAEVEQDFGLYGANAAGKKKTDKITAEDAMNLALAARDTYGDGLLTKIGGSTSGAEIEAALAEGRQNFAGSVARLGAQAGQSMANVRNAGSSALGFDVGAMYAQNYDQVSNFGLSAAAATGAPPTAPSAAQLPTRADLMSTLNTRLGQEQADARNAERMGGSAAYTKQQQAQVKQVEAVLSELASGNQELFDTLISRLQEVSKKQKDQAARARSLPL